MNTITSLKGKKILFIGVDFYEYTTAIVSKLEEAGGTVSFFSSSNTSTIHKILLIFRAKKLATKISDILRLRKLRLLSESNDFVFILKGENLSQKDIDILKTRNQEAKFILYFWDDLKRIANRKILLRNFLNIWSFDPEDCEKYGFKYRPLFYRDEIKPKEKEIFLSSFGYLHSNRLEIFRRFKEELKNQGKVFVLKLYTDRISFLIKKFLKHAFVSDDKDVIITSMINYYEMMDIVMKSKFVLDIPHPSQNGLTIRTIEALKSGCHILTTNKGITRNTDISSSNYTVLTGNMKEDLALINNITTISDIPEKYSIDSFIRDLFFK